MDYTEFKRHLGKAGLSVNQFAGYLGIKPSAVSNHCKDSNVPRGYAIAVVLMGDARDRGADFETTLRRFGIYSDIPGQNVRSIRSARKFGKKPAEPAA